MTAPDPAAHPTAADVLADPPTWVIDTLLDADMGDPRDWPLYQREAFAKVAANLLAAPDPATDAAVERGRREWCREEDEHGDRCARRAEFLLWGKLFPPDALGPRCHEHAIKHTHYSMPSRTDQWAVYDLRPGAALADALREATAEALREAAGLLDSRRSMKGIASRALDPGVAMAVALLRDRADSIEGGGRDE
jgi:hypothetical protein